VNKIRKGNYYRLKTKKWLESKGYLVEILEHSGRYSKKDIWGSDLIAKNETEMVFIQVKSNKGDISSGKKQLLATAWPPNIELWVVYWEVYSKSPTIHMVKQ
jgi:Holliday junction resolvase-like predicted endonuclease